jgi:CheY-like chemotaxis protein
MIPANIRILLADDDQADCLLFKLALEALPLTAQLSVVHDGEQLMETLQASKKLPDVLFLDLNMPRKNGFASLGEIKRNTGLWDLPIIIFSTTSDEKAVKSVFRDAAYYYIRKPENFNMLKKVLYEALLLISMPNRSMPNKENFVITGLNTEIPELPLAKG